MHKVPKVVPDHFRSGSLILDQSNKDLIRNQGTIFFSHKILEDIGGKVPSFLISLDLGVPSFWISPTRISSGIREPCFFLTKFWKTLGQGSLIPDQSYKALIRNQGTMFISWHKILDDIGARFPLS